MRLSTTKLAIFSFQKSNLKYLFKKENVFVGGNIEQYKNEAILSSYLA